MTTKPKYIALNNFAYPKSLALRNRLRKGEKISMDEREMIEVEDGSEVSPPDDLLVSWLKRGLVKEKTDGSES